MTPLALYGFLVIFATLYFYIEISGNLPLNSAYLDLFVALTTSGKSVALTESVNIGWYPKQILIIGKEKDHE